MPNRILKNLLFVLSALTVSLPAVAHPVAYEGATGLMWTSQTGMTDFEAVYSVKNWFAVGANYFWTNMSGTDQQYVLPRLNFLLHRWNGLDYQANIYAYGGLGAAWKTGSSQAAFFVGGEADYETQKFYTSAKAMTLKASGFDDVTLYQYRIGVAPYIADSNSFHTWAILQAQYFPTASDDKLRIGPMLRFFYKNVLWEVGVTTHSDWNFNAMIHF